MLSLLVAGAVLWRAWVASLTPVPSEDGVNYLWMAEQFARGAPAQALGEVFPPLLPLLIAPWLMLGIEPFRAAQAVLAVAGALALLPLARAAERLAPGQGANAALLALAAPLPTRFCAEVYTEPLFILWVAVAIECGLRARWWSAGAWTALAFWTRPEALAVGLGFVLANPRAAWRAAVPLAGAVLALAAWRGSAGHGFDLLPKLGFNWQRSALAEAPVLELAGNLARIPWLWVEAFGVSGLLALLGLVRARAGVAPLRWMLGFGVLAIGCFVPRRRFLVSWYAVVSAFAAVGLRGLRPQWRLLALLAAVSSSVWLSLRTTDQNRRAERALGEHLAALLRPGEHVVSDLTRVMYFAKQRPLPPSPSTAGQLLVQARGAGVRFVVLGVKREAGAAAAAGLGGEFEPLALPAGLAEEVFGRGLLVLTPRR